MSRSKGVSTWNLVTWPNPLETAKSDRILRNFGTHWGWTHFKINEIYHGIGLFFYSLLDDKFCSCPNSMYFNGTILSKWPLWRHRGVENKCNQIGSYHIPLESCFDADSESKYNLGLKTKSFRVIIRLSWSRDQLAKTQLKNLINSEGLRFKTQVLFWFWISIKPAFQRYMIWPYLVKFIFHPPMTS